MWKNHIPLFPFFFCHIFLNKLRHSNGFWLDWELCLPREPPPPPQHTHNGKCFFRLLCVVNPPKETHTQPDCTNDAALTTENYSLNKQ